MAYKLIKYENGVILTGDALKAKLTGFTIPELPPLLMTYQELDGLRPKGDQYPKTAAGEEQFRVDYEDWKIKYKIPFDAIFTQRTNICNDFAQTLREEFRIASRRKSGLKLYAGGIQEYYKYLSFAILLTERDFPWKFPENKIDWICFKEIN